MSGHGHSRRSSSQYSNTYTSDYQGTGRKFSSQYSNTYTSDYQGTGRKISGQHSSTYKAPVKEKSVVKKEKEKEKMEKSVLKKEKGKEVQRHEDQQQLLELELDMFSQS